MNRPAIVDFSQVEEALKHTSREREMLTARERTKNTTQLIKYAAAGLALVIVSIGVAFWLGTQWHRHQTGQPTIVSELLRTSPSVATPTVPANKVVTKVNLFNSLLGPDLGFFNPYFMQLAAGHEYSNSNADRWEHAWCYASFRKHDLHLRVELETRKQFGHVPQFPSQRERTELGLSDADVLFLRSRCPWR